jgi:AraC family transcriptional regulator
MDMTQRAVERAIDTMWARYYEPLSLAELAETAILSKFYFSRVFRSVTGTSPGRFLTAIRLFKAKQLLLETPLSVTDISYRVGYNSLGTFTSRFTRSVGVSPGRYRSLSVVGIPEIPSPYPLTVARRFGTVHGKVTLPMTQAQVRIYVGAFASPIVEGVPAACDILDASGGYELPGVPEGEWFVRAAAVAVRDVDPRPWMRRPLFVGTARPLVMRAGRVLQTDITMRQVSTIDLPLLLALPELDSRRVPEPVSGELGRPAAPAVTTAR